MNTDNLNKPDPMAEDELREKLAAIEHERWADWQKWVHNKLYVYACPECGDKASLYRLDRQLIDGWQRQIDTPYEKLTDQEKASDREQVDRYWPLIEAYTTNKIIEAQIKTVEKLLNTSPTIVSQNDIGRKVYMKGLLLSERQHLSRLKALNHRKDD